LQLALAVNSLALNVAIDVNTAGCQGTGGVCEKLISFEILQAVGDPGPTGGADIVLAHYTGAAGGTPITPINANGNGYADWILTGFTFAGLGFDGTERIYFHANWTGAVDGAESFFLLGAGPTVNPNCPFGGCDVSVPGPIAGAGLPGLLFACGGLIALARRRRQQTV
jgi:hypothetical protein